MTLDEARELLEVGEDADARAIRRAYLRGVKAHSPERDPQGFARVREAFELCRRHVRYVPEAEPELPLADDAGTRSAPNEPGAPVSPVSPVWPEGEPTAADWEVVDRCYDEDLGVDERVAFAEELLARWPRHSSGHWARYDTLRAAGRNTQAVAALREAHALGLEDFLAHLAQEHTEALTDDELEAVLDARPFVLTLAPALMLRAPERVVDAVEETLEHVETSEAGYLWTGAVRDSVPLLLSLRRAELARRLFARLRAYDARVATRQGDREGVHWLLTTELMGLPDTVSLDWLEVFASTLMELRRDPNGAIDSLELRAHVATHTHQLKSVKRCLRAHAPNLHTLFGPRLIKSRAPQGIFDGGLVKILAMLALLVSVNQMPCHPSQRSSPTPSLPDLGTLRLDGQGNPVRLGTLSNDPASRNARRLGVWQLRYRHCPAGGDTYCVPLMHLLSAVQAGNCVDARLALWSLESSTAYATEFLPDPRDRAAVSAAVDGTCPRSSAPTSAEAVDTAQPSLDAGASSVQSQAPARTNDQTSP